MALLFARTDRTGVLMVSAVPGVLYLAALIAFTVAPGPLLRFRCEARSAEPTLLKVSHGTFQVDSQGVSRADPPGMRLPTSSEAAPVLRQ